METVSLVVYLIVKADDKGQAMDEVTRRLNGWFTESPNDPPFPVGTLLLWRFGDPEEKRSWNDKEKAVATED